MLDRQLLACRSLDHLAYPNQVAAFVGGQPETQCGGIGQGVEHSAPGDVHVHCADAWHLHRRVQLHGKCGHVLECDRAGHTVAHLGTDTDEAGRGLQHQIGDRLDDRHEALVDQHRRGADRVRAGHGRVFGLLHDHEARIGFWERRRQHHVRAQRRVAARLAQKQPSQAVTVRCQVVALLEHRRARHVMDAADHHPPGLATGMRVDRAEDRVQTHGGMVPRGRAR